MNVIKISINMIIPVTNIVLIAFLGFINVKYSFWYMRQINGLIL